MSLGSHNPPVFHLPQARNPHFVGREDLLKRLDEMLRTEGPAALVQVVAGMGGVGKTQLAVEYAYRKQSQYDVVWSVRCEQPSTLASDYAGLADRLDLPEKVVPDQSVVVQAVRRWLELNRRWLLVMDNVVNPNDVTEYLPENPTGDIIITSQNQQWFGRAQKLPVEQFKREESLDLLLGKGQRPEAALADANALAEALGDLPLALAQAAAYRDATGTTIDGYLKLFNQRRVDLWQRESPPVGYQRTVAETLSLATDRLRAEAEPALRLLNLCALLAPDDIPRELLASSVANDLDFNDQLASLRRYSLVNVTDGSVSVHRLVQTVCRDRWSEAARAEFAELAVAIVESAWPTKDFQNHPETWPTCARLTLHARAVLSQTPDSVKGWRLLNQLGIYCLTRADFEGARFAFENSTRIAEAVFGLDSPELANSLSNVAQMLQDMNRLAEAESLMRRALDIDEQSFGADHPNVARDLSNLAGLLWTTNRLAEAEPLIRRALAIDEQSYGKDHPKVAVKLNTLTQILQDKNCLDEAEPLMRRALAIDEQSYGADHPRVAVKLNNLSQLLQATNRLVEAESLMARVVLIFEKAYGNSHPNVSVALNNFAQLFKNTNRLAGAEPLMRRALLIDEQCFGAEHPRVACDLSNLALLLKDTKRLDEAEPMLHRALAIDEQSFGAEHPNVATDLNNLAQLLKAMNRLAEAEPLMRSALAIHEQSYGPDHPEVATNLNNLALLLQATNRLAEAEPLLRRALAIDEQSYGAEHPDVAMDLWNLAVLLRETGRLSEALPLMQRAMEIFHRFSTLSGYEHPHWNNALWCYSNMLAESGQTDAEVDAALRRLQEE